MRGFTGKHRQLWREDSSKAEKKHGSPENDLEMSKQETKGKGNWSLVYTTKSRKIALAAIAAVLLAGSAYLGGQQYIKANTVPYYRVYVGGKEIGTIASEAQLQALYKRKEQEYREKYPQMEMALHTEVITTKQERAYKAEVHSDETLNELYGMLTGYAKGVELRVNGKVVAIVKDKATAEAVLKQVKGKYIPKTAQSLAAKVKKTGGVQTAQAKPKGPSTVLESAQFAENISKVDVKADPNKVMTTDEAVKKILRGDEEAISYEVQEGDTISSIASRFDVTQKELFHNNPEVKELSMQIGTVLNIKAMQPSITVKTVERTSETLLMEPEVIIRKSESMKAGKSKVISLGAAGLKTMLYRVTKENGQVIDEEWLGQEVVKKAAPKIVLRGTKVILGEGSGQFAWPVASARMTSSYGERWGRTHKGVDLVSSNRSILAADDGVVIFTGEKTGYGNCIIINHKNGYETLYGHLSKISVKKGQVVEKGTKIGVMGSTGRSTGTHLHFEIHENGSLQNPMKYL
ncbi:peptidoglycan DD-metalloendopeptidase family protein [Paenibacillus puldeungensis]|uniref:Peptidoglycan DD-metalloendopeptidase family protein n=1 Tax=Paenibacillus puldeungensis TaxID=696536 RepID=A0ABW3RVN8_9BACL